MHEGKVVAHLLGPTDGDVLLAAHVITLNIAVNPGTRTSRSTMRRQQSYWSATKRGIGRGIQGKLALHSLLGAGDSIILGLAWLNAIAWTEAWHAQWRQA